MFDIIDSVLTMKMDVDHLAYAEKRRVKAGKGAQVEA